MKNKKIIFIFMMLVVCSGLIFADFAISFGPAYTNYFVQAKTEGNFAALGPVVNNTLQNAKNERNNAAGFALDLRSGLFYLMTQIAFPGTNHSDLAKDISSEKSGFLTKNAFILDTQLGAGITLFKKTKFNLFLGGGIGINAVKAAQTIDTPVGKLNYDKLDVMFGAGVNILASYYFTNIIGIYAGVADTFYFTPLTVKKRFKVEGVGDITVSNTDNNLKEVIANSLNLKLGLSIRL